MIYLDTCILIFSLERKDYLGDRARSAMRSSADALAISPLVVHECLVMPLRTGDVQLRDEFMTAFERLDLIELDLPVFIRAAELRAASRSLRVPDSLHLAAAQLAGCDELWTNDKRLADVSRGLAVDIIGG